MTQQELHLFLEKLASGHCTNEEQAQFDNWAAHCSREDYRQMLTYWERLIDKQIIFDTTDVQLIKKIEHALEQIDKQKETPATPIYNEFEGKRNIWPRIAAAASILLFLFIGSYYLLHKPISQKPITQNKIYDIVPGGNKAVLILSNGGQILLSAAHNGTLVKQGNITISKTVSGQIIYTAIPNKISPSDQTVYHTLITPKGGQYGIVLPDGSKVLLNAASSLRYPVTFNGTERKVELQGEAYFEVAHNNALPFRVVVTGQLIEDIGTHFNINAYHDDLLIKTTLLEGSIKVTANNHNVILKPGQQSQVNINLNQQNIKVIENADTEEAVAWKNGLFEFKNATIKQVMDNAARWYNLNVIYQDKIPDIKISGRISRNVNFSGLIDLLQFEGLKFKIQGQNVTILN